MLGRARRSAVPVMSSTHEDVREVPRAMKGGISGRWRGCAVGMRGLSEGPPSRVTGVSVGPVSVCSALPLWAAPF